MVTGLWEKMHRSLVYNYDVMYEGFGITVLMHWDRNWALWYLCIGRGFGEGHQGCSAYHIRREEEEEEDGKEAL